MGGVGGGGGGGGGGIRSRGNKRTAVTGSACVFWVTALGSGWGGGGLGVSTTAGEGSLQSPRRAWAALGLSCNRRGLASQAPATPGHHPVSSVEGTPGRFLQLHRLSLFQAVASQGATSFAISEATAEMPVKFLRKVLSAFPDGPYQQGLQAAAHRKL